MDKQWISLKKENRKSWKSYKLMVGGKLRVSVPKYLNSSARLFTHMSIQTRVTKRRKMERKKTILRKNSMKTYLPTVLH